MKKKGGGGKECNGVGHGYRSRERKKAGKKARWRSSAARTLKNWPGQYENSLKNQRAPRTQKRKEESQMTDVGNHKEAHQR